MLFSSCFLPFSRPLPRRKATAIFSTVCGRLHWINLPSQFLRKKGRLLHCCGQLAWCGDQSPSFLTVLLSYFASQLHIRRKDAAMVAVVAVGANLCVPPLGGNDRFERLPPLLCFRAMTAFSRKVGNGRTHTTIFYWACAESRVETGEHAVAPLRRKLDLAKNWNMFQICRHMTHS